MFVFGCLVCFSCLLVFGLCGGGVVWVGVWGVVGGVRLGCCFGLFGCSWCDGFWGGVVWEFFFACFFLWLLVLVSNLRFGWGWSLVVFWGVRLVWWRGGGVGGWGSCVGFCGV